MKYLTQNQKKHTDFDFLQLSFFTTNAVTCFRKFYGRCSAFEYHTDIQK